MPLSRWCECGVCGGKRYHEVMAKMIPLASMWCAIYGRTLGMDMSKSPSRVWLSPTSLFMKKCLTNFVSRGEEFIVHEAAVYVSRRNCVIFMGDDKPSIGHIHHYISIVILINTPYTAQSKSLVQHFFHLLTFLITPIFVNSSNSAIDQTTMARFTLKCLLS